jgi:hypothetical protein
VTASVAGFRVQRRARRQILDVEPAQTRAVAQRDRVRLDAARKPVQHDVVPQEVEVGVLRLEGDDPDLRVTECRVEAVHADVGADVEQHVVLADPAVEPVERLRLLRVVAPPPEVGDPVIALQGEGEPARPHAPARGESGRQLPAEPIETEADPPERVTRIHLTPNVAGSTPR